MDRFALDRRAFVAACAATALSAPFRATAAAAPPIPSWKTELKPLGPNIYAFIREGGPGIPNGSISNAGVLIGPDNVTLIDTLGPPVHAKELKRMVEGVTRKPVTRIINTHHHRDHTNGNYLFQPAEIVMSPAMAQLATEDGIPANAWANRPNLREGIEELRFAPPTTIVTGEVTYRLGDIEAEVMQPGRAHTFGDIMVYLPKQKILFAGDIAFFYSVPAMHTSDPASWLKICERIQAMDVDVIVPGHGPVGGKRQLADMAELIRLMQRQIRIGYDKGLSPGQTAAAADLGRFGGWAEQERLAWAAVRFYALWSGKGATGPHEDAPAIAKAVAEFHAIRKDA